MIAVMDQTKETFVLKKRALTSNSLVLERVTAFLSRGSAMVMTTASVRYLIKN
jgi:hypothetical protein